MAESSSQASHVEPLNTFIFEATTKNIVIIQKDFTVSSKNDILRFAATVIGPYQRQA